MNKKGFTLLEMTIVVLIVSVLFLLVVPNIKQTMGIVNERGCKALEKVGDAAILEYRMQYDAYPGDVQDLVNAGLLTEKQTTCDNNEKHLVIYDDTAQVQ